MVYVYIGRVSGVAGEPEGGNGRVGEVLLIMIMIILKVLKRYVYREHDKLGIKSKNEISIKYRNVALRRTFEITVS